MHSRLYALLFLAAIYATLTRSVWMSGMLTLALVVGLAIPWNWRLPILGVGLLLAGAVFPRNGSDWWTFKRDRNLSAEKTAESVELRPCWPKSPGICFSIIRFSAADTRNTRREHVNYLSDRSSELVLEKGRGYIPHNVVFSLLTETGLIGLGMFLTNRCSLGPSTPGDCGATRPPRLECGSKVC